MRRNSVVIWIVLVALIIGSAGVIGYFLGQGRSTKSPDRIATLEQELTI